MKTYYGVDFDKQREALLKSKPAAKFISEAVEKADAAVNKEYAALKVSDYMSYFESGNRSVFEERYFERRNDCSFLSVAYWLTEDEKYLMPLINLIFHICDEYTWCVPAHLYAENKQIAENIREAIDLFQSETARLLTDIAAMLGKKLPGYVTDRIKKELRERIICSLLKNKFLWAEEWTNNWAAVCAGGTGIAVLHYATEEEKEKLIPVLNRAIEHFLSGFNDDGCCMEGCGYWSYGFGYFLIYAKAMLAYTDGRVNLFDNEKVKQIALFNQRVRMGKAKTASFSDGGNEFSFNPGMISLLRHIYGKEVQYPDLGLGVLGGNVFAAKELLWFDVEYKADAAKPETTFFKESEWYVKQSENYSFAVKGGNNDEPHNHNDVGSFMLVTGEDFVPLADLGSAEYRKETFDVNVRYTLLNNGSQGHSVPIINGKTQEYGEGFAAKNVTAGEDFFEADIEGAYPQGLINKIRRRFEFKENSVHMCDSFEFSEETRDITERFVTWTKPEASADCITIGSTKIRFDGEGFGVKISEDSYKQHKGNAVVKVYLIDFAAKNEKEKKFEISVEV